MADKSTGKEFGYQIQHKIPVETVTGTSVAADCLCSEIDMCRSPPWTSTLRRQPAARKVGLRRRLRLNSGRPLVSLRPDDPSSGN